MYVFRLHVRPNVSAWKEDAFKYCLEQGILGVGWRTESNISTKDWDIYYGEAVKIHGKLNTCEYIKKWVTEGCLVWTRDIQGSYYLARVLSGWEYFSTDESRDKDIDIANIFRVKFERMTIDEVPGKVVACFIPRLTMQEIKDQTAIAYSKFIWNKRAGYQVYTIDKNIQNTPDIFSLFDFEEVEDLVLLYLQTIGYIVVPNSRKANTLNFEYIVTKPQDKTYVQVQVKTGGDELNREEYANLPSPTILFQSNELYKGKPSENVTCLKRSKIESFLHSSVHWLPSRYRNKMEMLQAR